MAVAGTDQSLTNEIVQETLKKLSGRSEFEVELIEKLAKLAADGGIKKAANVTSVLKPPGATP